MKLLASILLSIITLLLLSSCNTLYNTKTIDIEIFSPSTINISKEYRKLAVQYNNINVAPSNYFSQYNNYGQLTVDESNTDSIASLIYYKTIISELKKHGYFDSVMVLPDRDYSNLKVVDTIDFSAYLNEDSTEFEKISSDQLNVLNSSFYFKRYTSAKQPKKDSLFLHPRLGLYTSEQLHTIYDSTAADLLLSLDFFGSADYREYVDRMELGKTEVVNWVQWSFYDLKKNAYLLATTKNDTVSWEAYSPTFKDAKKQLPSHTDALYNAAEISAEKFAASLVPHWSNVQRMYYSSGHIELKQTDELVANGQWLEAAKIWKANTTNKNKMIAAKCMFNLALACEMQDDLEAAMEWVIESFYVFENKNEMHAANCMNYIRILGLRKSDLKLLDKQLDLQNLNE
ncbi:DUF6340 family protein [Draconibacterium sp. IB214405]|uniref:DUF6340 family protein n=1 Tax=Draconibacterium sp. IB214405 TaxID=3097352 RepID=UPI002A0EBBFA|nr:DUF6340 family protein [Draconibacterium sp. IB214405]MDX8339918.1 DUF6340 family protein [Draconibacterium sp. IB214405]